MVEVVVTGGCSGRKTEEERQKLERGERWERINVVDTVPILALPAGMYCTGTYTGIEMPTFHTGLNTGHAGQFQEIPTGTEKSFFFFFF